ncbi:MAG: hypothetical protein WA208_07290 [Thermoanaerobaculia bacterium]
MGWDDADLTVGKLFRVWRWFDQQTLDGNARGVTSALLDRHVGAVGFAAAMERVGWLEITPAGLALPNFDRHNGETAKTRALTSRRVQKFKANAEGNGAGNAGGNGGSVTGSVSGALPREEKEKNKRERKSAAPAGVPEGVFDVVRRLMLDVDAAGMVPGVSEQELVCWVAEYGEELILETLRDCATDIRGKSFKYALRIIERRHADPSQRPGARRAAAGGGRRSGAVGPDLTVGAVPVSTARERMLGRIDAFTGVNGGRPSAGDRRDRWDELFKLELGFGPDEWNAAFADEDQVAEWAARLEQAHAEECSR